MKSLSIVIAVILALGFSTQAMAAGKSDGATEHYFKVELKEGR